MKTNNPSIYVGTYAKYNNGSIFGAWLNLTDYPDAEDFYKACKELHADEHEPEFMFQDFDNFPKSLYSESGNIDEIYNYINFIDSTYLSIEAVEAGIELGIPLDKIEEAYRGEYESGADYAEDFFTETGQIDKDDRLTWYIDWEKVFEGELEQGLLVENGHYFWANY